MKRFQITLATSNPGKLREINQILTVAKLCLAPLLKFTEVIEDGATFELNAAKKAVANAKLNNTYCFGEDSGIEINFLNGQPGIYSARFSDAGSQDLTQALTREQRDENNNSKVLKLLGDTKDRGGKYVCALALSDPQGEIIFIERAESLLNVNYESRPGNGFGYDFICSPVEYPDRFYSELTAIEKNEISHRAKIWSRAIDFLTLNFEL